ncbi:MAG TPA: NTP transferase domain-containing protein [Candidatus Eremiobacteraceae bacterium]
MLDAVITAGGRLSPDAAERFGSDVKALVRINGKPMIATVVDALRATPGIGRIAVVGPSAARSAAPGVDQWIDEFPTGEENLIAAVGAAQTERIVMSASDLPFVTPASYASLIEKTGLDIDAGYPVFGRAEFLRAYPRGRKHFATLADGEWTGASAFVFNRTPLVKDDRMIRRAFAARKSLFALASLLGPVLLFKFLFKLLTLADVEQRAGSLLGAKVRAVRGADPALAMDCDDPIDFAYAHAEEAKVG